MKNRYISNFLVYIKKKSVGGKSEMLTGTRSFMELFTYSSLAPFWSFSDLQFLPTYIWDQKRELRVWSWTPLHMRLLSWLFFFFSQNQYSLWMVSLSRAMRGWIHGILVTALQKSKSDSPLLLLFQFCLISTDSVFLFIPVHHQHTVLGRGDRLLTKDTL